MHYGQFVTMMRQPEQRIISAFHHNRHEVIYKSLDLPTYGRTIAGCAVRLLNGLQCNGQMVNISSAMVRKATGRLENGFAFVGLIEEYALSVCLFHKMFGGQPEKREFLNIRPGKKHSAH